VIIVAGEQFVGRRAGNGDLETAVMDGFRQEGMNVVTDGRDGGVMIGDQVVHAGEETLGRGVSDMVTAAQRFYHRVDVAAFVVSLVLVDDRKAMDFAT